MSTNDEDSDENDLHNTAIIEDPADESSWIMLADDREDQPADREEEPAEREEQPEDEREEQPEDEREEQPEDEREEEPEDEDIHNTAIIMDDEEYNNDEYNADISITRAIFGPTNSRNFVPMSTPNVTHETLASFYINETSHETLPTPPRPITPTTPPRPTRDSESEPDSPIINSRRS